MSDEFISVLKSLFPPISEKIKQDIKKLIKRDRIEPSAFFTSSFQKNLIQGDIITNIPFVTFAENDKIIDERLHGMLLSTPCDFKNNDRVLFAPCYSIDYFIEAYGNDETRIDALKKNIIFDKFYIPPYLKCSELIVDFNGINTHEVKFISAQMISKKSQQISCLTSAGYYYLLAKLTVHFLRPESESFIRN